MTATPWTSPSSDAAPAARQRPAPRLATVVRTERLTPHLVRLVLGGEGLRDGFAPTHADSYVKLLLAPHGVSYPEPFDLAAVRARLPSEHWPRVRTYTLRSFDADLAELALDVVVHGEAGVAGPWAVRARPGDRVHLQGPGGAYSPDPDVPHLLVGDESALPAIAVALERLPPAARVRTFVEVPCADDVVDLGRDVTWLPRDERPVGQALVEAVTAERPADGVHAFVHGEAGFVKVLRRWLRLEHEVPMHRLSISGYWRAGVDDEVWRASKASWTAESEAEERRRAA